MGYLFQGILGYKNDLNMFSQKIIFAVEILLQLELVEEVSRHSRGTDVSAYLSPGAMRRTMSSSVLRQLVQARYIASTGGRRFVLLRDPSQITLLQLVQLFHGALCIGEPYDHYGTLGYENYPSQHYRALRRYEKRLSDKWSKELGERTISDLRHDSSLIKHTEQITQ